MKVKVIKGFIDKYTLEYHAENSTFECDEKRYNEIQQKGNLVEIVEKPKAQTETEKPTKKRKTT